MRQSSVNLTQKDRLTRKISSHVFSLLTPVTLALLGALSIQFFSPISPEASHLVFIVDEFKQNTKGAKVIAGFANAGVIVGVILITSCLFLLLYHYRYTRLLYVWLFLGTFMVLGLQTWVWFDLLCAQYQLSYELVTTGILLWNYSVIGILCIFTEVHPRIRQGYLLLLSVTLSTSLCQIPEWTAWMLLLAVSVYDCFAVLLPYGPLKLLFNMMKRRQEVIPGLLYEPCATFPTLTSRNNDPSKHKRGILNKFSEKSDSKNFTSLSPSSSPRSSGAFVFFSKQDAREFSSEYVYIEKQSAQQSTISAALQNTNQFDELQIEERNPLIACDPQNSDKTEVEKEYERVEDETSHFMSDVTVSLGQGDFVFYCLLACKAASLSYISCISACLGIAVGLVGTLFLVMYFKVPLPALPASIALGTVLHFSAHVLVLPRLLNFGSCSGNNLF